MVKETMVTIGTITITNEKYQRHDEIAEAISFWRNEPPHPLSGTRLIGAPVASPTPRGGAGKSTTALRRLELR